MYIHHRKFQDNSGKISSQELKLIIGSDVEECDEKVWSEMIKGVDTDGDGEMNYEEFVKMMRTLNEGTPPKN